MQKFIGWIDEPSGGLYISSIEIDSIQECTRCGEEIHWELGCDCESLEPDPQFICWVVKYPGIDRRGRKGTAELELTSEELTSEELKRQLRDARDAQWPSGDLLFISDDVDDLHEQYQAFIAEA